MNIANAINILLETEVCTNIANKIGNTCLMHAIRGYCSEDVLQVISDHGAAVNDTDNENLSVSIRHYQLIMTCEVYQELCDLI